MESDRERWLISTGVLENKVKGADQYTFSFFIFHSPYSVPLSLCSPRPPRPPSLCSSPQAEMRVYSYRGHSLHCCRGCLGASQELLAVLVSTPPSSYGVQNMSVIWPFKQIFLTDWWWRWSLVKQMGCTDSPSCATRLRNCLEIQIVIVLLF